MFVDFLPIIFYTLVICLGSYVNNNNDECDHEDDGNNHEPT